jgi:hypothetical protein
MHTRRRNEAETGLKTKILPTNSAKRSTLSRALFLRPGAISCHFHPNSSVSFVNKLPIVSRTYIAPPRNTPLRFIGRLGRVGHPGRDSHDGHHAVREAYSKGSWGGEFGEGLRVRAPVATISGPKPPARISSCCAFCFGGIVCISTPEHGNEGRVDSRHQYRDGREPKSSFHGVERCQRMSIWIPRRKIRIVILSSKV